MATITPLLDTLLHEVLGRRMDSPSRPQLTPPVAPVYPTKAAQAVQGDSRLQARGGAVEVQAGKQALGRQSTGAPPGDPASQKAASTYTRLSPAAHLISSVLARFPAPPSVVRPAAPLLPSPVSLAMPAAGEVSASSSFGNTLLQERLSTAIRDSGLFYESHLKSWFRGTLPVERLLRQPQMQGYAPASSTSSPSSATPSASGVRGQAAPSAETIAREPSDNKLESLRGTIPPLDQSETLQSLLRHQLELLVAPVLRWEGEIWPGLFLSLVLELPRQEVEESHREDRQESATADECHAELSLALEGLGSLQARLHLREDHLNLVMTTGSSHLYALMQTSRDALMERLNTAELITDLHLVLEEVSDDQ